MVAIVTLIVTGSLLMLAEVFLPGMIAGMIGLLCFLAAVVLSYATFEGSMQHLVAVGIFCLGLLEFLIWLWWFPSSRLAGQFISKGSIGVLNVRDPSLLGRSGVALTDLRPAGSVRLDGGERIDVVAEGEMLSKGEHVKVVTADGIRIVVRRLVAGKPSSA